MAKGSGRHVGRHGGKTISLGPLPPVLGPLCLFSLEAFMSAKPPPHRPGWGCVSEVPSREPRILVRLSRPYWE